MNWKPLFSTPACAGALVLGLAGGCGQRVAPEAPKAPPPPPANVTTVHLRKGEVTRAITLPGEVRAFQQVTLFARVNGYLKTITVDKGDAVQEGALLADLEVPELLADLAKYKAEAAVAALDYQRLSDAQKKAPDLVVPLTVDNAKGKYEIAKASLDRTETLLGFAKITAPFSGVVTKRMVDPGAFIPAASAGGAAQNGALLTLADFSKVRVQTAVPESEVRFITKGLPVKVAMDEVPGHNIAGTVTRYSHALDEATKTMVTEIEVPNPTGELRPGMFARVKIFVERKTDAPILPSEAVLIEKTRSSVFIVVDGKAKKIGVKTGFNDGVSAEILDGLKGDEPVILLGKQPPADGQSVNVVEAK